MKLIEHVVLEIRLFPVADPSCPIVISNYILIKLHGRFNGFKYK